MKTNQRLQWVIANRTPRGTIPPIGAMISGLVENGLRRDGEQRAKLASILAGCVDHDFRRHCRMGDLHDGMLVMEVDEPGLISILRGRWVSKIEAALHKRGAKTGVRSVLFKF